MTQQCPVVGRFPLAGFVLVARCRMPAGHDGPHGSDPTRMGVQWEQEASDA